MKPSVFVIAEYFDSKVRPVTYELVRFAQNLATHLQTNMKIVLVGNDIDGMALEIADKTGADVIAIKHPELVSYNVEIYAAALGDFFINTSFSYICIAHSTQGMDFAPALAVKTNSACIAAVENSEFENDRLIFYRTIFNGKAVAKVISETESTILTIQPGITKTESFPASNPGSVTTVFASFKPQMTKQMGVIQARKDNQTIAEADIIISAGRGIGKKENLNLIYKLADIFSKSAVGGSRPLCDLGWLDYQQQIGITGMSVSPNLYFALGISGAIQHLSGIRGARFIVAVNTDPNAAIFNMADICIVEDLTTFIPALIEAFKETVN